MKVDVIMPIHKGVKAEHLNEAISSIVSQTYKTWVLYLGVDGVLDIEQTNILNRYKGNTKIEVFHFEKSGLPGLVRDKLIKKGKGELIVINDSDDISYNTRIERLVSIFKKGELDLLWSAMDVIDEYGNEYAERRIRFDIKNIKLYSFLRSPINNASVSFLRDKYIQTGYKVEFQVSEDYWLWVQFISKGYTLDYLDEKLLSYRQGTNDFNKRRGMKYFHLDYLVKKEALRSFGISVKNIVYFGIGLALSLTKLLPPIIFRLIYRKFS